MNIVYLLVTYCLSVGFPIDTNLRTKQDLIVIEQDYEKALQLASQQNKLLFIDFYTTWCAPCKKLDKLIFQNDSIQQILGKDFILLKYDAENDSIFHLSKKHHVSSYPTAIVLNNNGYVLNRKYGFPGDDFRSLSENVLEFKNESLMLNSKDKVLKGYSKKIDATKYPKFYNEYIERTNTKVDPIEINDYWSNHGDVFSEEYFSTLLYFAQDAGEDVADLALENRDKYLTLFGPTDVDILFYFLSAGKFEKAVSEKSQIKFDEATSYVRNALDSDDWVSDIITRFEMDLLKAKGRWNDVFDINKKLKKQGQFSAGAINHFCWNVYKECEDQAVIRKCLKWMKEITKEDPSFDYLDTYAFLAYKSGNKTQAKKIARQAIEVGKKNDRTTTKLEELLTKV